MPTGPDEPATSTASPLPRDVEYFQGVACPRGGRMVRGGASRPGSARQQVSAASSRSSRRDRAARSPDPQPASCRRPWRGFRARAAPSTRHRWCPRPDQASRARWSDVAGACAPTPGPAGAVPVRVALAHLPGFAGRFGIREDSIGRCARGSPRGIDASAGSGHVAILSSSHRRPASLPTAPWPRECPEGSAPVGEKTEGVRRRDEARLAAEKTPVRAGLLALPPLGDASAGKRAHRVQKGASDGRVGRRPEPRQRGP